MSIASRINAWPLILVFAAGAWSVPARAQERPSLESPSVVSARIDALFEQTWRDEGVEPAPMADDAMFLRRVYLDLTGVIPSVNEARAFFEDDRADKRMRLIDELLARPRHAARLANVWRHILLPRGSDIGSSARMEQWLERQFRDNTPYDVLARDVLTAHGSPGQSEPVVYYLALGVKPEELAASSSQVFLGVQIRCAQCHDHPFTAWKQGDFWGLAAFFARLSQGDQLGSSGLQDLRSGEVRLPKSNAVVAPKLPGKTDVEAAPNETRRQWLARWITSPENPYFARAAVNRIWGLMFGRGLVEPVDDMGEHNAASQPAVLDLLAQDFVASGYDVRRVFQVLAGSSVYQRTSNATIEGKGAQLFAVMPVRSLSAEQIYECLISAAGRRESLETESPKHAAALAEFLAQFDAPTRKATEFQAGIPQALTMLNGPLVAELTDPQRGDLLAAVADSPFLTDNGRIETLYLATLSRFPRDEERTRMVEYVKSGGAAHDRAQALADVLWALLNTSEFVLNR